MASYVCAECSKTFTRRGNGARVASAEGRKLFCGRLCYGNSLVGNKSPTWAGGKKATRQRHINKHGAAKWKQKRHDYGIQYKERGYKLSKKYRWQLRLDVIDGYGGACVCCGENHPEFMTIDHITRESKKLDMARFKTTTQMYRWLRKNDYPRDHYRLLCMSCNHSLGIFGYCPHDKERLST